MFAGLPARWSVTLARIRFRGPPGTAVISLSVSPGTGEPSPPNSLADTLGRISDWLYRNARFMKQRYDENRKNTKHANDTKTVGVGHDRSLLADSRLSRLEAVQPDALIVSQRAGDERAADVISVHPFPALLDAKKKVGVDVEAQGPDAVEQC